MATLNVGAMAARLGLDPSEFLEKMQGVQGFNGFVSGEMARQWKKTSRDGQEGMRLIDEAIGLHVARPVARIVSETFPALGKVMTGLLSTVAFSALGIAAVEFFEHIGKKMDEAKKHQEEYNEAVRKTKTVYADAMLENERSIEKLQAKIAGLKGDTHAVEVFKLKEDAVRQVEELSKQVDSLAEAERREALALAERSRVWEAIGGVWHELTTSDATLEVEAINKSIKEFTEQYADLGKQNDPLKAIADQAAYLKTEIDAAALALGNASQAQREAEAAAAEPGLMDAEGVGAAPSDVAGPSDKTVEALKAKLEYLGKIDALEEKAKQRAKLTADAEAIEAGKKHAEQLRTELEAINRLVASSQALASSERLAAEATGKGSVESVRAAAAAEAQKKIQDFVAEADTKYFENTQNKIAATREFRAALAAAIPVIQAAALAEQTSKAVAEYGRSLAELNTHIQERIATLHEEAAGHGRVAAEEAKELAQLIPLEEKLRSINALRADADKAAGASAAPAPAIGPPTVNQDFARQAAAAAAGLSSARSSITENLNPEIQGGAFREELAKIKGEMQSLAGGEISPWAKIDAQVIKLTTDLQLTAPQVAELRKTFVGLQDIKIAGEFEKLGHQIQLAAIEARALASGSPFGKLDAEAQKIGIEFGLDAKQIALVRQGLIELQSIQNVGKAWMSVDQLNAAGAKMQELRQQMDALNRAASTGQTDDGTRLSADALAAVRLEMQAIAAEEDRIQLKTGGISDGIRAWADELQAIKSEGEDVFAVLSQASKGFEDDAAKSVMNILDRQTSEHHKAIEELRKMWSSYFTSLAEMAMKQQLSRLLAPLGNAITGKLGGNQQQGMPNLAPTAPGSATGLGALVPGANGPGTTLTAAGTMLQSAATALLSAAAALRMSGSGSGIPFLGGGAGEGADPGLPIPFFAEGGDATPGSSFISGEAGAERVDLDRAGGAHVTPLGVAASGGDTHNHYDMRGAVVTDDLMRKADAVRMMAQVKQQSVGEAVANFTEIQRRTVSPR